MNFERIQEKKLKYEQNKHKISPVTLSSYEKDFELTFTHNSTIIKHPRKHKYVPCVYGGASYMLTVLQEFLL